MSQAFDVEGLNIKGKKVKIEGVLGVDKAHDLALLKLKGKLTALPIGSVDSLAAGVQAVRPGLQRVGPGGHRRRHVPPGRSIVGAAGKILEVSMPVPRAVPRRAAPRHQRPARRHALRPRPRPQDRPPDQHRWSAVPRTGKVAEFKALTQESFFETVEGNYFAGRAAMALDEQMTARVHMEKAVKLDPSDLAGAPPAGRHLRPAAGLLRGRGRPTGRSTELDPSRAGRVLRAGHDPA
ncbi:MAG: hypothetical protein MZV70_18270 [Desulfobacterales bacterium]|nr:hypothetical protein [Desulfobacterales bacterium]